jgi:hypothetical protein
MEEEPKIPILGCITGLVLLGLICLFISIILIGIMNLIGVHDWLIQAIVVASANIIVIVKVNSAKCPTPD